MKVIIKRHHLEYFNEIEKGYDGKAKTKAVFSYFDPDGGEYHQAWWFDAKTPELNVWDMTPEEIEITIGN